MPQGLISAISTQDGAKLLLSAALGSCFSYSPYGEPVNLQQGTRRSSLPDVASTCLGQQNSTAAHIPLPSQRCILSFQYVVSEETPLFKVV